MLSRLKTGDLREALEKIFFFNFLGASGMWEVRHFVLTVFFSLFTRHDLPRSNVSKQTIGTFVVICIRHSILLPSSRFPDG